MWAEGRLALPLLTGSAHILEQRSHRRPQFRDLKSEFALPKTFEHQTWVRHSSKSRQCFVNEWRPRGMSVNNLTRNTLLGLPYCARLRNQQTLSSVIRETAPPFTCA